MLNMRSERLLKNIIDQIKELQIKLGYAQEVVRLYYPVSSLNLLLDVQAETAEEMKEMLQACEAFKASPLGKLTFSTHEGRIEAGVPAEGVKYVHDRVETPAFLTELIGFFQGHHSGGIQEVQDIFRKFSENYVCEKMPEGMDFDYVLYFPEGTVDEYYYCVKEEMGHMIYHRFMKEDYRLLLEEL